eukprot:CAMPEP_0119287102 /NCGR_PEP_ID=MMETSP1329-20130426/34993_1 /TAXON_ID=114041 /ORGANISM="Genus nov. species nov., Strain RCC1024" /LENGTH=261 /DNA_ID=CAMNT_0007287857 /DNA_START=119 /DNA_END=901 /DNA_ORIENTATION=-
MAELEQAAQPKNYPQKKFFRSRAHCNPLSHNDGVEYPVSPEQLDWAALYPAHGPGAGAKVRFLDVGCGFGGLCVALAALSDELTLALEIRPKVCEFVRQRIDALREEHPGRYQNVSCLRYNAQSYLPNVVRRGQLTKLFFCFPDPHFKAKNHRRRIVSTSLLAEYAYALAPGGLLYCVTDVRELHEWHVAKLDAHPCFERVEAGAEDPFVRAIREETEEGKKVSRQGGHMTDGSKYHCVYARRAPGDVAPNPRLWGDPEGG